MRYFKPGKKKGTMFLDTEHGYVLGTHKGVMASAAYGGVRRILIGTGRPKQRIPTKLKGHAGVYEDWWGSCRVTIKLDSRRTKNADGKDKDFYQILQALENSLERKGYKLPPP